MTRRYSRASALWRAEFLDECLRTQGRLDRRSFGEPCRLKNVEDEMVEVALAHAAQIVAMRTLDVRGERGLRNPLPLETGLEGRSVLPGDPRRFRARLRARQSKGCAQDDGTCQ